jgi:hypothetical protein
LPGQVSPPLQGGEPCACRYAKGAKPPGFLLFLPPPGLVAISSRTQWRRRKCSSDYHLCSPCEALIALNTPNLSLPPRRRALRLHPSNRRKATARASLFPSTKLSLHQRRRKALTTLLSWPALSCRHHTPTHPLRENKPLAPSRENPSTLFFRKGRKPRTINSH